MTRVGSPAGGGGVHGCTVKHSTLELDSRQLTLTAQALINLLLSKFTPEQPVYVAQHPAIRGVVVFSPTPVHDDSIIENSAIVGWTETA